MRFVSVLAGGCKSQPSNDLVSILEINKFEKIVTNSKFKIINERASNLFHFSSLFLIRLVEALGILEKKENAKSASCLLALMKMIRVEFRKRLLYL